MQFGERPAETRNFAHINISDSSESESSDHKPTPFGMKAPEVQQRETQVDSQEQKESVCNQFKEAVTAYDTGSLNLRVYMAETFFRALNPQQKKELLAKFKPEVQAAASTVKASAEFQAQPIAQANR